MGAAISLERRRHSIAREPAPWRCSGPTQRGQRIGLQLFRRGGEGAAGVVEGEVEVLAGLGQARGELVVSDRLRRLGGMLVEELAQELRRRGGRPRRAALRPAW